MAASHLPPASATDFERVQDSELRAVNQGRLYVHVAGWNKGMKFIWMGTVNGLHYLMTPKTKRFYSTANPLLHLRVKKIAGARARIKLEDLF